MVISRAHNPTVENAQCGKISSVCDAKRERDRHFTSFSGKCHSELDNLFANNIKRNNDRFDDYNSEYYYYYYY